MSKYVKIAAAQFATKVEMESRPNKNVVLRETGERLESIKGLGIDLVVLSEGVESYGQSMEDAESLDSPGDFLNLYAEFAKSADCHVAGSVKLKENGKTYNSIVYVTPEGEFAGRYHKTNLTIGEIEMGLSSGAGAVAVDTRIGRLSGAVCFDLNFEDVRKGTAALKPDIITFASMYHGGLMQELWAYHSRAFFVSALPFMGCGILDPFGRPLALTDCYTSVAVATVNLDRVMVHLDYNRAKFDEIRKKHQEDVSIDVPPNLGPALIYSNSGDVTAMDIAREFELEILDDYLERSIDANAANRN
jgi:predicted amidohydrolase